MTPRQETILFVLVTIGAVMAYLYNRVVGNLEAAWARHRGALIAAFVLGAIIGWVIG